jgi:hypothetical protein
MSGEDKPVMSRTSRTGDELAELRLNLPRRTLAVIDLLATCESKSTGKFTSRTDIVGRLLNNFVQEKVDEATLMHKVILENPTVMENS